MAAEYEAAALGAGDPQVAQIAAGGPARALHALALHRAISQVTIERMEARDDRAEGDSKDDQGAHVRAASGS